MKYLILGEPLYNCRPKKADLSIYDIQQHHRLMNEINMTNQHNEAPLFDGPVHVDVVFYFSRISRSKKNNKTDSYYAGRPEIYVLLKWLQSVGLGIIFTNNCSFCSFTVSKQYAMKGRTEFDIRAL